LILLPFYKFLKFTFRYLIPRSWRYPLARWIAQGVILLNAGRRRVLMENLTPLVGPERARQVAPVLLGNFLMTAVDFFCTRPPDQPDLRIEYWSRVVSAYESTRRVIIMTAHVGNWEVGISQLVERGYSVAGVYATYTHDEIVRWITSHRNPLVQWIPTTPGAAHICVAALEQGRLLCMAGDIPFGEQGRRVTIAGHQARLPVGPWAIALRAKAIVLPAFVLRSGPGQYRALVHEPIMPSSEGSLKQQIVRMQDIYRAHLEHYLLTFPEQWGNLQRFWEN
jgi:lauroyl/myristoyl acyltransferase